MAANLQSTTSQLAQSLASQQIAVTTPVAVYTVPASTSAVVKHGVLCNVSGQQVGTVNTLMATGTPITVLPVTTTIPLGQGAQIVTASGGNTQTWTLSAPAAAGATVNVNSQTPNFAYPVGALATTLALSAAVTLSIVPSGGAADGTHVLIHKYNLDTGDSLSLAPYLGGAQLAPGDVIYVTSAVPSVVDVSVTGVVST